MNEIIIAIVFGLLLTGLIVFVLLWDKYTDDDDDDPKPPYRGGGGGGSTSHAVRTATIGGGIGGV